MLHAKKLQANLHRRKTPCPTCCLLPFSYPLTNLDVEGTVIQHRFPALIRAYLYILNQNQERIIS